MDHELDAMSALLSGTLASDGNLSRNAGNLSDYVSLSDGIQIGLTLRQPSFSSLCGSVVTKSGDTIAENPPIDENPVIVFDQSNQTDSVGSPGSPSIYSFVTNKEIQFSPTFTPIIEDTVEEEIPIPDDINNPHLQVIKRLVDNNQSKWKLIGYEPPKYNLTARLISSQTPKPSTFEFQDRPRKQSDDPRISIKSLRSLSNDRIEVSHIIQKEARSKPDAKSTNEKHEASQ